MNAFLLCLLNGLLFCSCTLAAEFGVPLWQKLGGPQLETDWILTFGWKVVF